MEFQKLRKLVTELEGNVFFLENRLRDTSLMLYSKDDQCEGIKVFQDMCEQWNKVCDELEEANKKDVVDIQEISQDLETTEIYFHDLEEKLKEHEHFLLQKSLLIPDPDEAQNGSIPHLLDSLEISERVETPASNMFSTSHASKITVHSTPDLNDESLTYLEDTMSEFQSRKDKR